MPASHPPSAYQRIGRLAEMPLIHQAFHYLHLHEKQFRDWQLALIRIPAPPFAEHLRAEWLCSQFIHLGLAHAHIDQEGNVLAELAGLNRDHDAPCVLLSAHIDTVFPAGTPCDPIEDGRRILAPGACDNAAGVTALLALASAFTRTGLVPGCAILFAGNVGEEGEGNLRGMRYLFQHSPYGRRIAFTVALDGGGSESVVAQALGSRRYRITLTGPGGHSWADASAPNPILVLSRILAELGEADLPANPRTTLNIGTIEGGTAVNAIPESATAQLDVRSIDREQLIRLEVLIHNTVEDAVLYASPNKPGGNLLAYNIQTIGDRPAAALPSTSGLLHSIRAVDRHLQLRTEMRIGSTDANIPLSLGREAISIGAGGTGGGVHTRGEWYDPTNRELALRRILLLLLDLCNTAPSAA